MATDKKPGDKPEPMGTSSVPKKSSSRKAAPKKADAKKASPAAKAATATETSKTTSTEAKSSVDLREPPERPMSTSDKAPGISATDPVKANPVKVEPSTVEPSTVDKPKDPAATPPKAETPPPAAKAKEPATEPPQRRSTFWPLLIGGALAAALGFAAAEVDFFGTRSGQFNNLRAEIKDQDAQITALREATPEPQSVEFPALEDLTEQVAALSEQITALDGRLTTVEKQPISGGSSEAAVAAYERELEALQASVAQQRAEIEGLLDNALSVEEATADAARRATLQSAMTRITTALSAGRPFAAPLAELQAEGADDVPAALTDVAETGVTTLINLQTRFPDAARAALSTARTDAGPDGEGGFGGFLRRQLGARSVAPREGTDPDAVLSRAEAAVGDARLTDALAEIDTLPEPAQAAMADWLADARARQAAEAAADALSQRLTAN